jgi:predicted TIM-barrel fold metal-dependent hydrolase
MGDARWRAGFAQLPRAGLRFDLQVPWAQLGEAARLARDFPDAHIILNHTGLPADRSREGIAAWKNALKALAASPNAAIKISGLGVPGQAWTAESNREVVLAAIDVFGIERAMFASNFPVDGLCASFDAIATGMREILLAFPAAERRAFFYDNAVRIYDMEKR